MKKSEISQMCSKISKFAKKILKKLQNSGAKVQNGCDYSSIIYPLFIRVPSRDGIPDELEGRLVDDEDAGVFDSRHRRHPHERRGGSAGRLVHPAARARHARIAALRGGEGAQEAHIAPCTDSLRLQRPRPMRCA